MFFAEARAIDGKWHVPDGWQQGRGAWGGLLIAAVVRAAVEAEAPFEGSQRRSVRSVTAHMLAPVPADGVEVAVALVRRGSATAMWRVEVLHDGGCVAEAMVVLADARAADLQVAAPSAPDVPAWTAVNVVEVAPPLGPAFATHLEFRPIAGYPYSGQSDDVVSWIRPSEAVTAQGGYDAGALLGLVDALWPASLIAVTSPRPMATLSFAASLLVDPATLSPVEPLLHRGHLVAAAEGYVTETRELWTADGRLAVMNTQVVTIIR